MRQFTQFKIGDTIVAKKLTSTLLSKGLEEFVVIGYKFDCYKIRYPSKHETHWNKEVTNRLYKLAEPKEKTGFAEIFS